MKTFNFEMLRDFQKRLFRYYGRNFGSSIIVVSIFISGILLAMLCSTNNNTTRGLRNESSSHPLSELGKNALDFHGKEILKEHGIPSGGNRNDYGPTKNPVGIGTIQSGAPPQDEEIKYSLWIRPGKNKDSPRTTETIKTKGGKMNKPSFSHRESMDIANASQNFETAKQKEEVKYGPLTERNLTADSTDISHLLETISGHQKAKTSYLSYLLIQVARAYIEYRIPYLQDDEVIHRFLTKIQNGSFTEGTKLHFFPIFSYSKIEFNFFQIVCYFLLFFALFIHFKNVCPREQIFQNDSSHISFLYSTQLFCKLFLTLATGILVFTTFSTYLCMVLPLTILTNTTGHRYFDTYGDLFFIFIFYFYSFVWVLDVIFAFYSIVEQTISRYESINLLVEMSDQLNQYYDNEKIVSIFLLTNDSDSKEGQLIKPIARNDSYYEMNREPKSTGPLTTVLDEKF